MNYKKGDKVWYILDDCGDMDVWYGEIESSFKGKYDTCYVIKDSSDYSRTNGVIESDIFPSESAVASHVIKYYKDEHKRMLLQMRDQIQKIREKYLY